MCLKNSLSPSPLRRERCSREVSNWKPAVNCVTQYWISSQKFWSAIGYMDSIPVFDLLEGRAGLLWLSCFEEPHLNTSTRGRSSKSLSSSYWFFCLKDIAWPSVKGHHNEATKGRSALSSNWGLFFWFFINLFKDPFNWTWISLFLQALLLPVWHTKWVMHGYCQMLPVFWHNCF